MNVPTWSSKQDDRSRYPVRFKNGLCRKSYAHRRHRNQIVPTTVMQSMRTRTRRYVSQCHKSLLPHFLIIANYAPMTDVGEGIHFSIDTEDAPTLSE